MVHTAPMKSDIIMTSGIESMPSLLISNTVRLPNTFHRSGTEKTLFMNMQYLPKFAIDFVISIFVILVLQSAKVRKNPESIGHKRHIAPLLKSLRRTGGGGELLYLQNNHLFMKRFLLIATFVAAFMAISQRAEACSRILYVGDSALRVVGRSLDWKMPIPTNLYVYPRGMRKKAHDLPGALKWVSKYGAIYAVSYDGGITEGMNEKGLVVNGLFCKGTVYANDSTKNRPPMSLAMFVGWLLDLNATTAEAVKALREHDFNITGATFDGGTVSALHWGITDADGNSAILEFDNGTVKIYEGEDIIALTNDPDYPQMMAIENYWKSVGGQNMLPGTVKSPDRFVRGTFFGSHVEKTGDAHLGFVIARSILDNVSVPYHYTIKTEPNVSSTQWRSFSNLRDRLYYFDQVTNNGTFYVDLKKCDLREGASVMKLETAADVNLVGEANRALKKSAPFTPMY